MKAKTFKRMSKRFISSLLSVLMVLSLFTVCMVGSTVTVGAFNINGDTTIKIDASSTGWSTVYFYIGDGDTVSIYEMNSEGNGIFTKTLSYFDNYDGFFFANGSYTTKSSITATYEDILATNKSQNTNGSLSIINGNLQNDYNGKTIKITTVNTTMTADMSQTGWKNNSDSNGDGVLDTLKVYLYVGNSSSVTKYTMTQDGTKYTAKVTTTGYSGYFFSYQDKETTGTNLYDLYNSIGNQEKSASSSGKLKPFGATSIPKDTVIVKVSDIVSTGIYYLDATLYNYRNTEQVANAVANSSTKTDYTIDSSNSMYGSEKNGHMYKEYNEAVAKWFGGENWSTNKDETTTSYTPLYEGNFHDLTSNSSFPKSLYHWVRVANAANRYDNASDKAENDSEDNGGDDYIRSADNIKSSAQNLVDETMNDLNNTKEGTITQHGVELPQFSDTFTNNNPTLQSKYSNLKFEVTANKKTSGNIWYSYDSSSDGNRYLELDGDDNDGGKLQNGVSPGSTGYYPFDKPGTGSNLVNSHGTRFDVSFVMPADGTGRLNNEDLQFTFTGDDDLWVYIDGYLALDLGGSHAEAEGSINLRTKEATIKTGVYNADYNSVTNKTAPGTAYNDGGTDTSDGKLADITQPFPSGLTESLKDTTKEHTMTIFYMERGQYDSNLSFEFFLPQTNSLKIEQKIDTTTVNAGLLKETLNTADKDVHEVVLKSNSTSATSNDTAEIPVVSDFKRVDADGAYALLQHGTGDISNASGVPFKNTTGSMVTAGTTTFVWEDTNTSFDASKKSFGTGTGIVGDAGEVDLLYNQSATFNDQFTLGSKFQLIPTDNLSTFVVGEADSENPPTTKESTRTVSKYYTQTVTITDNEGNPINATDVNGNALTGTPTDAQKYYSFGTASDTSAKITASYTNTVNTGTVKFTKKLDAGTDTTTTFKFAIEFANIFGGNDTDAFDEYPITYKILKSGSSTPSAEQTYNSTTGIVLNVGDTAIIEGIPVDTKYRIIEESTSDASKNYSVASVTNGSENVENAAIEKESTKGGIVATVGTVASDKENIAHLDFNNTNKTTPVVYRFKDRLITSGLPTAMEDHYTYFTREIPGTLTGTDEDRNTIVKYAPTIKNLMKTYSLSTADIEFGYELQLDGDLRVQNSDGTYTSAEGIQNLNAGDEVIVATYTSETRKYTVDVTYPDESGNYSSKAYEYPFNELIKLGEIRAPKTYTVGGTQYNFRYWAKLVNVDGTRATTYTPVSTNYSYSYRVTDNIVIRAIYDKDLDFKQLEAPVVVDDADYNVSGVGSGYDASAAERVYDSYSKDIVNDDSTITSQDRTRVNVLFGAVGSKDIDENITEVGYILLQKTGSYATDNLFSDSELQKHVPATPGTQLTSDITIDGTTYKARRKSFKVDGYGYVQDPVTGEWKQDYVAGEVNLTNKNRVNIVFDIKNDGSNLEKYYTCYTFMKRVDYEYDENGNQIGDTMKEYTYVSETPAYFNLHEAEPYIQDIDDGEKSYPVVEAVRDTTGKLNGNAGTIGLSKQNIKDGQKLVVTITPTNHTLNGESMESKLKSFKIGTIEITEDKFESYTISKTGTSVFSIIFDDETHLPENLSTLEVTAVFEVKPYSDFVDIDTSTITVEGGSVKVSSDGTNYGTTASVKRGEKFYLQAVANTNYVFTGWTGSVTGTTNPIEFTVDSEGEYGTLPTPKFAECIEISGATYTHGSVQLSTSEEGTYSTSIKLIKGTEQKFYAKAIPNSLYELTAWSDGTSATTNPIELTFNADGTYDPIPVPTFEEITEKIIYFVDISNTKMSEPQVHIWKDGSSSDADYSSSAQNLIELYGTSLYTNNTYTGILYSYTYQKLDKDYDRIIVHKDSEKYIDTTSVTLTPGHIYAINDGINDGDDTVTDIGVYNSADWRKYETVTVSGKSVANGSVTVCATQNGTYSSSIELQKGVATTFYAKAEPNSGYEFTGWSGSATGTTNPIAVTLSTDGSYTLPTPEFKLKGVLVTFKANISGWGDGYNASEVKIKYKNSSSQWVYATMTYDQSQSNPSSNLYVFTVLLTDLATGNNVGFNMLRVDGDDQMGENAWIGANHNNNETQYTIVRATDGSLSITQS